MLGVTTLLLLAALPGCSEAQLDTGVKSLFSPRRTPQQYMLVAVSAEDPDVRRDAASRVAKSKQVGSDWAVRGFIAIALLESDPQSRCVAIRALTASGDPRATETLLKLLNYRTQPPAEVRPPEAVCRWDAAVGVAQLLARGQAPADSLPLARTTLLDRLRNDAERHVRVAAARGLAQFRDEDVLKALIAALEDNEHAVVHEAESSLVALTGHTAFCDAQAWTTWVEENREHLFAEAGNVPEPRRPPYRNGLQKSWYNTREVLRWLWPGSKE